MFSIVSSLAGKRNMKSPEQNEAINGLAESNQGREAPGGGPRLARAEGRVRCWAHGLTGQESWPLPANGAPPRGGGKKEGCWKCTPPKLPNMAKSFPRQVNVFQPQGSLELSIDVFKRIKAIWMNALISSAPVGWFVVKPGRIFLIKTWGQPCASVKLSLRYETGPLIWMWDFELHSLKMCKQGWCSCLCMQHVRGAEDVLWRSLLPSQATEVFKKKNECIQFIHAVSNV